MTTSNRITIEEAHKLLDASSGTRPRIYGELKDGQRVSIPSKYYLDKYVADLSFMWISTTTIADLVGKA